MVRGGLGRSPKKKPKNPNTQGRKCSWGKRKEHFRRENNRAKSYEKSTWTEEFWEIVEVVRKIWRMGLKLIWEIYRKQSLDY